MRISVSLGKRSGSRYLEMREANVFAGEVPRRDIAVSDKLRLSGSQFRITPSGFFVSTFDKGLTIAGLHMFNGGRIDREHSSTPEHSRRRSAGSARASESKKEDVDHFSSDRLYSSSAAGKRNFSLPAERTMPRRVRPIIILCYEK
jgi:hypothetical protein